LPAGRPATLEFTRETDDTCATEVVFPTLGIRSALPLGEPVTVTIEPQPAGDLTFVCGMNMLRGTLVVERR
jgi:plastocyanin domain-containing protein